LDLLESVEQRSRGAATPADSVMASACFSFGNAQSNKCKDALLSIDFNLKATSSNSSGLKAEGFNHLNFGGNSP
jgi:hypothetical protein